MLYHGISCFPVLKHYWWNKRVCWWRPIFRDKWNILRIQEQRYDLENFFFAVTHECWRYSRVCLDKSRQVYKSSYIIEYKEVDIRDNEHLVI